MDFFRGFCNSLIGALVGLALSAGSVWLIFWNEDRAVQTHRSLTEAQTIVLHADPARREASLEGKLIYLSGEAKPAAPLVDDRTNLRPTGLVLERNCEMYQWSEDEHRSGSQNAKTYSYSKQWHGSLESSGSFHQSAGHQNPNAWKVGPGKVTVSSARLGVWQVPAAVLREIDAEESWQPTPAEMKNLPPKLASISRLTGGELYLGKDPDAPEIGDERVRFQIVPVGPISIIAQQAGNSLAAHHTSNGRSVLLAEAGTVSPEAMFQHAFSQNRILTWVLRAAGTLLMFIGLRLIIEPLTAVTDWIPFLGDIVDIGVTLAAGVVALASSATTIAVAWFAVRPVLSVSLIVGAVGLFLLARKKRR